jgi:DNA polymerase III delta prime subunit
MQKFFNTTGFCNPADHYMVDPLRGLGQSVLTLIGLKQYFILHAPRQTGKTTFLHALAHQLNRERQYVAAVCSLEAAGYASIGVEAANEVFIRSLHRTAQLFLSGTELPPNPAVYERSPTAFGQYLTDWSRSQQKPVVLLLDEVDALYDDVLVSVLRQLRDGFQARPSNFPQSIALVGLRDMREYRTKAKEGGNPALGAGSPFNIKAESFLLSVFSKDDVQYLLQQHTDATGQVFSEAVLNAIYEQSGGQPWLTNALANEIVQKLLANDFTRPITVEMVETAKERLIAARQTHLDSLVDKLKEERVQPIVLAIVSGNDLLYDNWDDDLRYCLDLGIVKAENGNVTFANPIYREIITRVMNSGMQGGFTGKEHYTTPFYIHADGRLDMDKLLQAFQQFYRENAEHWLDRFQYKEAGHQLLLMAFLQRIINGGGRIEREMAVGSGRTDLAIYWMDQVVAIEMKIKWRPTAQEKGLRQLSRYLDTLGQTHGYLVLFEPKQSDVVPWETRIGWEMVTQGNKQITVIQM